MFEVCKQDIIGPLIVDLCDFLKFIYDHFPHIFILDLNSPERVYRHYAEIIRKSSLIAENKRTENEYYKLITEPFVNFIKHRKSKYTYQDIKYLMNLMETIDEIPDTALNFEYMVDFCVVHNINSPKIYQFIINEFKLENEGFTTHALKVKHFNYLKRWVETTDCICLTGYRPLKDSMKHKLSMWLKKEYNFFNYNMHITAENLQSVNEKQPDYAPKIKTNFTVAQLACFMKYIIDREIFITNNKKETVIQLADVFTSKNSGEISYKSLLNKFFNVDEATQKYIKQLFLELAKSIDV